MSTFTPEIVLRAIRQLLASNADDIADGLEEHETQWQSKFAKAMNGWTADNVRNNQEAETLKATIESLEHERQAHEEVHASHRQWVRRLDVIWNGEKGAAKQAALMDIVVQIERELPAFAAMTQHLDLMRDEFQRIAVCPGVTSEIKGLCERAISGIHQHVPVIVQRDNAERKVTAMRNKLYPILEELARHSKRSCHTERLSREALQILEDFK